MLSPLSRGLFHRAISHSGSVNNGWSDPAREGVARANAIKIAENLGCSVIDTSTMIECLRGISGEKLTGVLSDLYEWDNDPVVILQPVIEVEGDGAFITERSIANQSINIPWLIGIK